MSRKRLLFLGRGAPAVPPAAPVVTSGPTLSFSAGVETIHVESDLATTMEVQKGVDGGGAGVYTSGWVAEGILDTIHDYMLGLPDGVVAGGTYHYQFRLTTALGGVYTSGDLVMTPTAGTVVLLAFNEQGADGTGSFVDGSASAKAITKVGTLLWSNTVSPVYPSGNQTSAFTNALNYATVASSIDFAFGLGDLTIEAWITVGVGGASGIFDGRGASGDVSPVLYVNNDVLSFFTNGSDRIVSAAGTIVANTPTHVALSRNSGVSRLWKGGVQKGSDYADSNNYIQNGATLLALLGGGAVMLGYCACLRVTKGAGLYPSAFSPPAMPLSNSV